VRPARVEFPRPPLPTGDRSKLRSKTCVSARWARWASMRRRHGQGQGWRNGIGSKQESRGRAGRTRGNAGNPASFALITPACKSSWGKEVVVVVASAVGKAGDWLASWLFGCLVCWMGFLNPRLANAYASSLLVGWGDPPDWAGHVVLAWFGPIWSGPIWPGPIWSVFPCR
jgi:hypothetical protein